MDKTNFIIYKDSKAIVNLLDDAQAGKLFKSIFDYVEDRTEIKTDDGMLKIAFTQMKITLERDLVKYKKIVERNKENGKLGGRPKLKPKGKKDNPNNPSGLLNNPKKPKKADSGIDSGIDNGIDSDNKKKKIKKKPLPKKLYLDFVKLTADEYKKLVDKFGEQDTKDKIQKLDDYIGSKGTKYVSHYRTILNWSKKDEKDTTLSESDKSKEIKQNLFGGKTYVSKR